MKGPRRQARRGMTARRDGNNEGMQKQSEEIESDARQCVVTSACTLLLVSVYCARESRERETVVGDKRRNIESKREERERERERERGRERGREKERERETAVLIDAPGNRR